MKESHNRLTPGFWGCLHANEVTCSKLWLLTKITVTPQCLQAGGTLYTRASSNSVVTTALIHHIIFFSLWLSFPLAPSRCVHGCHPPAGFGPGAKKAELLPRYRHTSEADGQNILPSKVLLWKSNALNNKPALCNNTGLAPLPVWAQSLGCH